MDACPVCGSKMTEYGIWGGPSSDSRYICARCGHGYDPSFATVPLPLRIAPGRVYYIGVGTIKADLIAFPLACPTCGHVQPHVEGGRFCIECGVALAVTGRTERL
jgi:rubrerythrin